MHRLTAHPALPPRCVSRVQVRWRFLRTNELILRWRIDGTEDVVLPPLADGSRADDLWKTTCFELFLDFGDGTYREFNFSPSGQWAAYDFSSYRQRLGNAEIAAGPVIEVERGNSVIAGAVRLPVAALGRARNVALCTVIEEEGGVISFWANAHGDPAKPDFHDRSCFVIDVGQPE